MRKMPVILIVISALLFGLMGCGSNAEIAEQETSGIDGVSVSEAVAPQQDEDTTPSPSGLLTSYDLPGYVNSDFIFRGTIVAIEKAHVDIVVQEELMGTVEHLIITTRIDEVYSGDLFKTGDTAVVLSGSFSVTKAEAGLQAVFFASDLETVIFTGETLREHLFESGYGKQNRYLELSDLYIGLAAFGVFPYSEGLVSAQLIWAEDVVPSIELTKEAKVELAESNPLKPGGYLGRAYFTNEDFIKALSFYQEKYPPGSSFEK